MYEIYIIIYNTIWDMIQKIRILLTFCGYSQDLINQIIEEHE